MNHDKTSRTIVVDSLNIDQGCNIKSVYFGSEIEENWSEQW